MSGEVEKCPEKIWDQGGWRSHTCLRPVKRDGLCGIHASARERRRAGDEARSKDREISAGVRDRMTAAGFPGGYVSGGSVIFPPDAIARLVTRHAPHMLPADLCGLCRVAGVEEELL